MNHLAHLLLAHRAKTCLVGAVIADRLRPAEQLDFQSPRPMFAG
jgi:acyl carrier protein phosphodiesterase